MTPRETAPKSGRTSALEIRTRFATPEAAARIPIPFHVFAGDIACAGLEIVEQIATWPGVSPQCYLALRKTDTASPAPGRAEHHGGRDETAGPGSI